MAERLVVPTTENLVDHVYGDDVASFSGEPRPYDRPVYGITRIGRLVEGQDVESGGAAIGAPRRAKDDADNLGPAVPDFDKTFKDINDYLKQAAAAKAAERRAAALSAKVGRHILPDSGGRHRLENVQPSAEGSLRMDVIVPAARGRESWHQRLSPQRLREYGRKAMLAVVTTSLLMTHASAVAKKDGEAGEAQSLDLKQSSYVMVDGEPANTPVVNTPESSAQPVQIPEAPGEIPQPGEMSQRSEVSETSEAATPDQGQPAPQTAPEAADAAPASEPSVSAAIKEDLVFPLDISKQELREGVPSGRGSAAWNPECGGRGCHHDYYAADIFAEPGTPVLAATSGIVKRVKDVGRCGEGGKYKVPRVTILGDDGLWNYYTHMGVGSLVVEEGQRVEAGDRIGAVGPSECAQGTPPHLHYQISVGEVGSTEKPADRALTRDPQPRLREALADVPETDEPPQPPVATPPAPVPTPPPVPVEAPVAPPVAPPEAEKPFIGPTVPNEEVTVATPPAVETPVPAPADPFPNFNAADTPPEYVPMIEAAAQRYNLDPAMLAAQGKAENGFSGDVIRGRRASGAGAKGWGQFLDGTFQRYGVDGDGDGKAEILNPADSIMSQANYMRVLLDITEGDNIAGDPLDHALAAYNAGPGNYKKYRGVPPFSETRNYVAKIRQLIAEKFTKRA